jgi:hypothetical protein
MIRETSRQLMIRMMHAQDIVPPGRFIRHVRTGGEYIVKGHSLRVGDLAPMVEYSPLFGPVVVFSRNAHDIRRKFVLMDGDPWPDQPFTPKEGSQ